MYFRSRDGNVCGLLREIVFVNQSCGFGSVGAGGDETHVCLSVLPEGKRSKITWLSCEEFECTASLSVCRKNAGCTCGALTQHFNKAPTSRLSCRCLLKKHKQ